MKKFKSIVITIAFVIISSLSLAAGQLNYCLGANPEGFDPRMYAAQTTIIPIYQMYENLVTYNYKTNQLEAVLATDWSVSDDGLTYTFKLRKGVKFHSNQYFKPTRDFNADDVVYTIKSQLDNTSPYRPANANIAMWAGISKWTTSVKDVVKVDDYTVQIILTAPRSTFLLETSLFQGMIHSKEYGDTLLKQNHLEYINKYPIGTGAYQFADFQKDSYVRLIAFKDYWGEKPDIDKINFAITTDHNVIITKLEKNECDFTESVATNDLLQVKGLQDKGDAKNIKVLPTLLGSTTSILINTQKVKDVRVRKAISYALDYDKIMDVVFHNTAVRANTGVPKTVPGHTDEVPLKKQDIAKAKALLKEAGVKPGQLKLTFWYKPNNQNSVALAEVVQNNLKQIGINVEVITYEWGTYLKKTHSGEADFLEKGWIGTIPDPLIYLGVPYSCDSVGFSNEAMYCNKQFDEDNAKALLTNDKAERNKYYADAQRLINDVDVAQIPLVDVIKYHFGNTKRIDEESMQPNYMNPVVKNFKLKK